MEREPSRHPSTVSSCRRFAVGLGVDAGSSAARAGATRGRWLGAGQLIWRTNPSLCTYRGGKPGLNPMPGQSSWRNGREARSSQNPPPTRPSSAQERDLLPRAQASLWGWTGANNHLEPQSRDDPRRSLAAIPWRAAVPTAAPLHPQGPELPFFLGHGRRYRCGGAGPLSGFRRACPDPGERLDGSPPDPGLGPTRPRAYAESFASLAIRRGRKSRVRPTRPENLPSVMGSNPSPRRCKPRDHLAGGRGVLWGRGWERRKHEKV